MNQARLMLARAIMAICLLLALPSLFLLLLAQAIAPEGDVPPPSKTLIRPTHELA